MARWGVAVPGKLAERARQISDGRLSPAVPRDAATVILLRQAASGVETFLLRRTAELEFAPGAYVFPGGSVDARDADESVGWAGPDPAEFGRLLDVPPDRARSLVCAAVRETFEESGVLLAGLANSSPADLVRDSAALAPDRHALLTGSASLGEVLGRRGLLLRADLLTPGPGGSRPRPRPAASTPGSSPPPCRPGRRPRRHQKVLGTMRIRESPSRERGWPPPRRLRPRRPERSRCCRRPR